MVACTGQHRGDRSEQQDRVAVLQGRQAQRCALGVLADGIGGRSGGTLAAENVVFTSQHRFDSFAPGREAPEAFFRSLVSEIHTVLRLTAITAQQEPHSTFASVLLQPDRVDWCHVGDSRVYHFRGDKLMHVTRDHSYRQMLLDRGQTREQIRRDPRSAMLLNSMGANQAPEPEIGGMSNPSVDDSFLICSDGLWNHYKSEELGRTIAGTGCREAAAELIAGARARARGRGDNCSLVLLKYQREGSGAR